MIQPSTDGRATSRDRANSLALRPTPAVVGDRRAFLMRVRTRSTNIIGFSEMLVDDAITLTAAKQAEYAGIICAEGAALDRDVRLFLYGEN